jgi:phosphodiesterase/alkaline phosphatase D-like protein
VPVGDKFRRSGGGSAGVSASVQWAWVGAVGTATATVKARAPLTSGLKLLYSTSADLSSPGTVTGTDGVDDMWTFDASGLTANTQYYYGFQGYSLTGKWKTFPGSASFTVAAASCAGHPGVGNAEYITGGSATSNSPAFARILDRAPAAFIHLGDLHYRDISTASPLAFRSAYHDVMANARQADLYRQVPTAYIWDDHDFGGNDSAGTAASKATAQTAYRRYVPHWTVPAAAIYQTFAIGRVRFFLLDVRSERSDNAATDNASKTMLGATQKQWLKDQLVAATEKVLVICSGSAWNSSLADGWGSFGTEKAELVAYFSTNSLTDKIIVLHGDIHAAMLDDGTNSSGLRVAGFAPLDGGATTLSGTYTDAAVLAENQQYGTLAFADNGTDITVTATAWKCTSESAEASIFSDTWIIST